jgi:hypothetical protein
MKVPATTRLLYVVLSQSPKTATQLMAYTGCTLRSLPELLRPLIAAGYIRRIATQPEERYALGNCTPLRPDCTVPIPDEVFAAEGDHTPLDADEQTIIHFLFGKAKANRNSTYAPSILAQEVGLDQDATDYALFQLRGRGLVNQEAWYVMPTAYALGTMAEEYADIDYAMSNGCLADLQAAWPNGGWIAPEPYLKAAQAVAK